MADHTKKSQGTLLYYRPNGSVDASAWKIVHYSTEFSMNNGEAEEIDVTTHSSINGRETEFGVLDHGEISCTLQFNVNIGAGAATGESRENGAQAELMAARGTTSEFEYRVVLPKVGVALNTALATAPATDRSYISGVFRVKTFNTTHSVEGVHTAEATLRNMIPVTLTSVN